MTDTNLLGSVHGGVVMKLVDDVAGLVANRHSGGPAVTVALDEMAFLVPVRVGDLLHAEARVNWAGRTSMELGVRVFAERWDQIGPRHRVATAYLVFVAVDGEGEPRAVPQLVLETDEDGGASARRRSGVPIVWRGVRRSWTAASPEFPQVQGLSAAVRALMSGLVEDDAAGLRDDRRTTEVTV